jgi:hypothetical protein
MTRSAPNKKEAIQDHWKGREKGSQEGFEETKSRDVSLGDAMNEAS